MAWEGKESNNICIYRNCHQKILSKKSLPGAQELIWLGGGIQCLPPSDKGFNNWTNATPGTAMKESDEDIIACESVADEIGVVMVCNLVISLDDTSTIMHSQAQL